VVAAAGKMAPASYAFSDCAERCAKGMSCWKNCYGGRFASTTTTTTTAAAAAAADRFDVIISGEINVIRPRPRSLARTFRTVVNISF